MKTQGKTFLCVGGPLAGKRQHVLYGNSFRVPVQEPANINYAAPTSPMAVKAHKYREAIFQTSDGDISVWAPVCQRSFETMTMLLEGYEMARVNDIAGMQKKIDELEAEVDRLNSALIDERSK